MPLAESHKREGAPLKFLSIGLDACSKEVYSANIQLWKNILGLDAEIAMAVKVKKCTEGAPLFHFSPASSSEEENPNKTSK